MHQDRETREGWTPDEACKRLEDAGADVVGLNCIRGPATMLPLLERDPRARSTCHVAALPVPYRTTPSEPTFQSLRDPDCDCIPAGAPFPMALDPFTCNRYEIADSPGRRTRWACAISASAAAPARTTSARSPRRSGARRRRALLARHVQARLHRDRPTLKEQNRSFAGEL